MSTVTIPRGWSVVEGGMAYGGLLAIDGVHVALNHTGTQLLVAPIDGEPREVLVPSAVLDGADAAEWLLAELGAAGVALPEDVTDVRELGRALANGFASGVPVAPTVGFLEQVFGVENPAISSVFLKLATYLALDDPDALLASMAAAVSSADRDGEPLWLMLVGASSGGKSETIRAVGQNADARVNDITLAGLLTQRRGSDNGPSGLLADLGNGANAFVTISDMSSLLGRGSMSGDQQSGIFEALRDIYDGHFKRQMEGVSPEWHGRITFLAAVTPAIDQMKNHAEALGPRWVYFRLRQLDPAMRKVVAHSVTGRSNITQHRAEVADAIAEVTNDARAVLAAGVDLPFETTDLIEDAAILATYGRATVPRDHRGQVDGEPHWEEPGRLTHQLLKLARALTALGVGETAVQRVVARAATSSMPASRLRVLTELSTLPNGEWLSTSGLARQLGMNRTVARRALEDWEASTVVDQQIRSRPGDDLTDGDDWEGKDTRPRDWRLADDQGELVRRVLGAVPTT
jgi:hypothetical protein